MTKIQVFDPPMCCATGVCGPSVDPALATFAADLSWLATQGIVVERHNLSQEPAAFATSELVRGLLDERGEAALPIVVIDDVARSVGRYPSRKDLEGWVRPGEMSSDPCCPETTVSAQVPPAPAEQPSGCCGETGVELRPTRATRSEQTGSSCCG